MLSPRHRRICYWILALVFASGAVHFLLHQFFQTEGPFGAEPRPAEPWVLRIHGAAAMLTLLVLGSLMPGHVVRWWRAGRNRGAGAILVGFCGLLVISGYGLYYAGNDQLRLSSRWLHIILGLMVLPAFLLHLWTGKWSLRRAAPGVVHSTQGRRRRWQPRKRKERGF